MYLSTTRPRRLDLRTSLARICIASAVVSLLYLFHLFAIPQLTRFRFRGNLSWYDLGVYGFGPSRGYNSFEYESPVVEITNDEDGAGCDPRYTFFAPHGDSVAHPGPMILDAQGELVWMKHNWETTHDFKVQRYQDEDYLTYWEGNQVEGRGYGSWYMLDSTYTPRYVINPIGGFGGDLHEFHITPEGTALVSIYDPTMSDLSSIGGPELGWIYDCLFQEIDIATGELIFHWRASEYFPVNSTYDVITGGAGKERASAFDFFHLNSVDKDEEGNYIISSRHTHTVNCISRYTGEILWTLGGKTNEFKDLSDGEATSFSWQHDARWHADSQILTMFDNAVHSHSDSERESRGMAIHLDILQREVTMLAPYYHPQNLKSVSQGNVQLLDDSGRVLVAWGHSAAYSEFNADGQLECNVHFGASAFFDFGRVVSYRVFKGDWIGNPQSRPDAAVVGDMVYVSWNGATEVVSWRLESWDFDSGDFNIEDLNVADNWTVIDELAKTGFETEVTLPDDFDDPLFRLAALDEQGNVLGVTTPLQQDSKTESTDKLLGWHYCIVGIAFVASTCGLVAALYRISGCCQCRRRNPWPKNEYRLVPVASS
ncbi:ASST-domain-containing protein [Aspergillus cavernicola]|uniref:ASST-domain-containing protein n=1 Tax=Aspergillus cavernicola TaxID=176166 RepID=A0ABR4I7U5_9EURO